MNINNEPLFFLDVYTEDRDLILEISKNFWPQKNENLWFGEIPFAYLSTEYEEFIFEYLRNYFNKEEFLFDIESIRVDKGDRIELEIVIKLVYLIKEYFRDKKFRDPLCAHYNPRIERHVIHPGGTRQIVLDLFHKGSVPCFYFNTRGYHFEFLNNLEQVDIISILNDENYGFSLVPDHGSLIPHILNGSALDKNSIHMKQIHYEIKNRLENPYYKIYSNVYFDFLERWRSYTEVEANVILEFHNENEDNKKIHIKALLLALAGISYSDDELTVRFKH